MKYQDFLGLERPLFPVIIEAFFELSDDCQSAALHLSSASDMAITIIHEGVVCTKHEPASNEVCRLMLCDGEVIIILARRGGDIMACGLFQVNLGLYESISSVLIPVVVNDLEILQIDTTEPRRITERLQEVRG